MEANDKAEPRYAEYTSRPPTVTDNAAGFVTEDTLNERVSIVWFAGMVNVWLIAIVPVLFLTITVYVVGAELVRNVVVSPLFDGV